MQRTPSLRQANRYNARQEVRFGDFLLRLIQDLNYKFICEQIRSLCFATNYSANTIREIHGMNNANNEIHQQVNRNILNIQRHIPFYHSNIA